MGFNRRCSASGMFVGADIDSFSIIRRKYVYTFSQCLNSCTNSLIQNLYHYPAVFILPSVRDFYTTLYSSHNRRFLS